MTHQTAQTLIKVEFEPRLCNTSNRYHQTGGYPKIRVFSVNQCGIRNMQGVKYLKQRMLEQGQALLPASPAGHCTGSGAISRV